VSFFGSFFPLLEASDTFSPCSRVKSDDGSGRDD
jgi:hypothetical protein